MSPSLPDVLHHIRDEAAYVVAATGQTGREEFMADGTLQRAVVSILAGLQFDAQGLPRSSEAPRHRRRCRFGGIFAGLCDARGGHSTRRPAGVHARPATALVAPLTQPPPCG